ncbi:MAG: DUF4825 domain-containing protein [Eubacterium sp.]|nr:DUF4825 domain-containing protein [Eubacterium sp.]
MSDKISCKVIQDLLPSYIDGIVSEDSKKLIEDHLTECKECAEILSDMRAESPGMDDRSQQKKEIDYLKKIRRKNRLKMTATVVTAAIILCFVVFGGYIIYGGKFILANTKYQINVSDNKLNLEVDLPEGFALGKAITTEQGGNLDVKVESKRALVFWSKKRRHFTVKYNAKHAYIGDAVQDNWLTYKLGVGEHFGEYTQELQTTKQPYEWKMILSQKITGNETEEQEKMKAYSYVMLALVDNAEVISWHYETAEGSQTYRVTADEATAELKKDVKSYAEAAKKTQELMDWLKI